MIKTGRGVSWWPSFDSMTTKKKHGEGEEKKKGWAETTGYRLVRVKLNIKFNRRNNNVSLPLFFSTPSLFATLEVQFWSERV